MWYLWQVNSQIIPDHNSEKMTKIAKKSTFNLVFLTHSVVLLNTELGNKEC